MRQSVDEWLAAWSRRHGGYDVSRSLVVRCWLRFVWAVSASLARAPADVVSAIGVASAAAAAVVAPSRIAGGFVVATGVLDGVDGAVALRRGETSTRGAFVDATADRITDALFLFALARSGARRSLVMAAAFGTAGLEAQRARARWRGEPVTVVTPGERPFRVAYVALGLVSAPSAGAAVVAGTTLAGALALYRERRDR